MGIAFLFLFGLYVNAQNVTSAGSSFKITSGSNLSIQSASISNGTSTLTCTQSGNTWSCLFNSSQAGTNVTISIVVQNTGSGNAKGAKEDFTQSTCGINANSPSIGGCNADGTLTDTTTPVSISHGSTGTLTVKFAISPAATVGDTINIQTLIL